jgi:hypothetical protein
MPWRYDPARRLILPAASGPVNQPRSLGLVRAVVGWQELRPRDPTTPDKIKALAGQLSSEGVIYLCSILQIFLESIRGPAQNQRRQQQIGLARELLPENLASDVIRRLESGETDVVFHQEQLLLAARLAVAFGQAGSRGTWNRDAGGEFLLRVTDCLGAVGDDDESILRLVLRRLGAFAHQQERYLLPRYFDLLITRARAEYGTPSPFDTAFQAETGLPIETFLALGFAYSGFFTGIRTAQDLSQFQFDAIVSTVESRLSGSPHAEAARTVLTANRDWYRLAPFPSDRLEDLALATFVPFYDKPFYRVSNGSALPISLGLALQRLSIGVYWTVFTWFQRQPNGVVDLNALVGGLFQQYVTDALRSAYRGHRVSRFIPEAEIEGSMGQVSRPDGLIVDGGRWVSIEMTSSSLTMNTLLQGDVERLRAELADEKFRKKFEQPVQGAMNILSDLLQHPQLDAAEVTDIFPVVILLHDFPQFFNIWTEIDKLYVPPREIQTKDGRQVRVHKLQMLTAEELEMLEPGIRMGARMSDLLEQREHGDPVRAMSMKNFMFSTGIAREHDNERMGTLFENMVDVCRPILKELLDT